MQGETVRILFYGRLAEAIAPEIELDISTGYSVSQLREMLAAAHPDAAATLASKRSRACVGHALVGEGHLIGAGEQVEFLPPVSGG
jgi:molybdopterin converting factor small subunit